METLRPQGPVLHPKQQGGGMGTGEGGTCKARNPEGPDTGLVGGAE